MKYLIRAIAFVSIFMLLLCLFDSLFNHLVTQDISKKCNWIFNMKNQSFDMVVLGSSRAYRSIDPSILEQQLRLSKCVNFGIDGASYIESYLILSRFLKDNHTKYILLAADLEGFEPTDSELRFRLSKYLPYSNENTIKPILKDVYGINYFFMQAVPFMKYAKYNNEIGISSAAKVITGKSRKEYDDRGCAFRTVPFKDEEIAVEDLPVERRHLEYLNRIVELAQNNDCKLIFFIAPYHSKWKEHHRNRDKLVNIYQGMAKNFDIQLILFDDANFERNKKYFSDLNHLNGIGAIQYTNYVVKQLHPTFVD